MKKTHGYIVAVLAVIALSTILTYIYFFHNQHVSASTSDWGSFGDYFSGIITGILTPVTVYLVWMTYTSQSKEFKKLRQINEENTKLMSQQSFEQTFFSWMKSIKEIPPPSEISSASENYYKDIEKQLKSRTHKNTHIQNGTHTLNIDAFIGDDTDIQYSKKFAELKSNQYKWLETYMNALANFFQFIDNNNRNYGNHPIFNSSWQ